MPPRKLTNNVGAVTWSGRYSAYGVTDATPSGVDNPLRFPGQSADPETGLHYNFQRYYDPQLGVYAQQDPYGVAWTGPNRHLYANGDPMLGFDPTGEIVPAVAVVYFVATGVWTGFEAYQCYKFLTSPDPCLSGYSFESCINFTVGAAGFFGAGAVRLWQRWRAAQKGATEVRAIAPYYPINNGFFGPTERRFLMPGQIIDRYGGSGASRFFSPAGTSEAARALPPGAAEQRLRRFEVIKPFEVEGGVVAPAFGQPGGGTQFRTPVQLEILLKRGILRELGE